MMEAEETRMIRTLIVVLLVLWLLLAASATFVPGVWAGAPAAGRLDVSCDRDTVPRGVDSLIRCTYVATNEGSETWDEARLFFIPASGLPIPDRYFFFTYRRDGVEYAHQPGDISYAFGPIEPGGSGEIELEIIVNSRQAFGADVGLTVLGDGSFADTETMSFGVSDDPANAYPPLYGSLVRLWRDDSGPVSGSVASWVLVVRNTLDQEIALLSIEVFAPDYGVTAGLDSPQRLSGSVIGGLAPTIGAQGFLQRELRVETRGTCVYASPAVVVRGQPAGAEPVFAAILPPNEGTPLNCAVMPSSFPASGQGWPGGAATPWRPLPLALAATGAVLALLGAERLVRRFARGRRGAVR